MRVRSRAGAVALGLVVAGLALVGVAAWFLADSQADQRRDLRERFVDRTVVASSLVDSLFRVAFTGQAGDASKSYAGRISTAQLDAAVRQGRLAYLVVADASGRVLAASAGAPPGTRARIAAQPFHVRTALRDGFGLDEVRNGVIEAAIAFRTPSGIRLLIQGSPQKAYATFLAGTLRPLPTLRTSQAVVLDGAGTAVGGITHRGRPPILSPALVRAAAGGSDQGSLTVRGRRIFVGSHVLPSSRWRVLVTAPEDELYATVSGPGRWVPWVILAFAALALVAVAALLWRLAGTTQMLREANAELDASRRGLEERARDLERSNADLEQFAYAASHDLSEPLRTVAGFSQLLSSRYADRLDPEANEYIGYMTSGVDRMQQLIDDLLMYSRVGRAPAREDDVDLEGVLAEVLEWLAPAVRERGAQITHDALPVVRGERSQLAQVLQNLLANAIKFTDAGVVPVIHLAAAPEGDGGWRVSVRDNGIGVDASDSRIFTMFGRLHSAEHYPGTGIGLALAKRVVEGHGGRIWVEPGPDGGSVFSFTLPAGARARGRAGAPA